MLVLAGPGSGKSRVLTTRVAKLIADTPDRSFRVLAVTHTNRAADKMTARVGALVPKHERRAVIGTLHSFCMQMLQQHGSHIDINPYFSIYSLESDRQEFLRDAIRQMGMSRDNVRILSTIDKLKAQLVPPEGCARYFRDPADGKRVEIAYKAYEAALEKANVFDFGSLIAQAHRLITTYPGIAFRYQKTYRYWMIDEFQEVTEAQYELIRSLAGESFRNIFAVADDDQVSDQWNGAGHRRIRQFRVDYGPEELRLPTNYRCPPGIVAAANQLLMHNIERASSKRSLQAGTTDLRYLSDPQIRLLRYPSDDAEAAGIAHDIAGIERSQFGGVAVFARTRALLERLQAALSERNVPAEIAQRRDEFRAAQFQWMSAVLRQALRPLNRSALEMLTGAFNRWFFTDVHVEDVISASDLTGRSFLTEWALAAIDAARENTQAMELADLAAQCGNAPAHFRVFIDGVLRKVSNREEISCDIEEDRVAWHDLEQNIEKAVGNNASLEQFLEQLAILSKESPVGKGRVTLMTIRGSSSREFDDVYVIGLAEEVLPNFQSVRAGENSAEMEEERRNCFVAITRGRERLCLSYAGSYRGLEKRPSRFVAEMVLVPPDEAAQ
ncbi:MAG: ATP-dependent helicase [Alphaproteobacteria bacterium]|nr:ATP-dependent helicase [Alphaproteobacteria bacterium]